MENSFKDSELSPEVGGKCLIKKSLIAFNREVWSRHRAERICEVQWKVLVSVISTETENYDFGNEVILTFERCVLVAR